MTVMEVIFSLFIFAVSGAASLFALTSTMLQLKMVDRLQAVHYTEQIVAADWFAHKPMPHEVNEDGIVCKVISEDGNRDCPNSKTVQIISGQVSQKIWLPSY